MEKKSRGLLMANLYYKNKEFSMAEKTLLEHLDTNPEDWNALRLMAQVHEQNRDIEKAYEVHERCYLQDPSKSGIVLDICRVLLMSDIHLDNVDYKKWYSLGKDAFGVSHSIIKNFGEHIKTLPSSTPKPAISIATRNQVNDDSLSLKILEKLTSIEKRISDIENKLEQKFAGLSLNDNQNSILPITAKSKTPTKIDEKLPEPFLDGSHNFFAKATLTTFEKPSLFGNNPKPLWSSDPSKNQPVFSTFALKDDQKGGSEDNEEDINKEVEIDNFCQLKPIEQKTGEEDDDVIMTQRCKLYRLTDKEYKERGLDNIKVLKNQVTGLGRLVMRNQVTGKVCLNCWNFTSITRPSETTVRWGGLDQSDEKCESRVFLAKFKTKELADAFEGHIKNSVTSISNERTPVKPKSDAEYEASSENGRSE